MVKRVLKFLGDYLFEILLGVLIVGVPLYGLVSLVYSITMYLKL